MEIKPIVNKDFITIQDDAAVSEMIGKLKQQEKRSALIFRNKKYLGLIEKKRLLRSRIDTTKAKVGHYVQKSPILSENADVIESAYLMFQSNLDYLPVERNKQIIGVLEGLKLSALAAQLPETKGLKVGDIKLLHPDKVNREDPVSCAIEVMFQERIEQVPIFDQGKIFGIISYRDLLRKYLNWTPQKDVSAKFNKMASTRSAEVDMPRLSCLPVETFSTSDNLLTIAEESSLREAIALMAKGNVSDLLVMKDGDFKGLLTVKNILRRIGSLRIPKNFNIRFIGLNQVELEPYQKYNVQKIASNEAFKLQRQLRNETFSLTLHLKEYAREGKKQAEKRWAEKKQESPEQRGKEQAGKRHKYSVTLRLEFPGRIIASTEDDWDLETALHKAFDNARNEVKKKFRGDISGKKEYG